MDQLRVLGLDVERDDREAVPELDAADVADLDAGDVHALALARSDGLGRLELGLDLEASSPRIGNQLGSADACWERITNRVASPISARTMIATKSREYLLIACLTGLPPASGPRP